MASSIATPSSSLPADKFYRTALFFLVLTSVMTLVGDWEVRSGHRDSCAGTGGVQGSALVAGKAAGIEAQRWRHGW